MNTEELAKNIRINALNMTSRGKSSHIGCVFSMADVIAVLYGKILQYDVKNPKSENRDRFILSKGHAGAGVYAALAEVGFFDKEKLMTHYQDGSNLSGHVSHKGIPGVEFSTGSLGHGLPVAVGMALAAKKLKRGHRVFTVLGDGECDEGSVWEAALFANQFKLGNLVAVVDYNKYQSLDTVENTMALEPFTDKWESFGWNVVRVDGHDHKALIGAFDSIIIGDKPTVVIADTIKGKGVSFMENQVLWHYRNAQGDEFDAALEELTRDK
ncbi:transketolase [Halobacteriovorax sp. GB3]|uniref:transketolase n=1 Tax=Halobacteriovorax sp. GB3 TaxID=2719615 RepID=UPI0023615B04|nr:transketolase [Halobacteriovorax sp. GB3]MDD0852519.1 transketolase [Halobacteriovorax sp. GB3]